MRVPRYLTKVEGVLNGQSIGHSCVVASAFPSSLTLGMGMKRRAIVHLDLAEVSKSELKVAWPHLS